MKRLIGVAVSGLLALAACGGGGGGSGGGGGGSGGGGGGSVTGLGAAPANGPGDTAQYFPLTAGDAWSYDDSLTTTTTTTTTVTGTASVSAAGMAMVGTATVSALAITTTIPGGTSLTNYYTSSGGSVTSYGNNDTTDPITPQLQPNVELLFPVAPGTESTVVATNISAGRAQNGDAFTASLTQQIKVVDLETLSIAAGTFTSVAKVVETQNGSLRDTVSGQSAAFSTSESTWLAPGVGIVQDISSATGAGTTLTESHTLRSYKVGGVTHGVSPFTTLFPAGTIVAGGATGAAATNGSVVANVSLTGGSTVDVQLSNAAGQSLYSASMNSLNALPAVLFDGTNFEVITAQGSQGTIYSQRISPAGTAIDVAPGNAIALSAGCGAPSESAHGSSNSLIVYICTNLSTSNGEVHGLLVTPDGAPSAGLFLIHTNGTQPGGATDSAPSVAFDGTNFLVVWNLNGVASAPSEIVGARVSPSGVVLDTTPIIISDATFCRSSPDVTFDGTNYFVVWLDQRNASACGGGGEQVFGAHVSPAGTLLDGSSSTGGLALIPVDMKIRLSPVVGFTGTEYIVAWSDQGSNIPGVQDALGVVAERVSTTGTITTAAPFTLGGPSLNGYGFPVIVGRAFSSTSSFIDSQQNTGSGNFHFEVSITPP